MDSQLEHRCALITGASGSIGGATARAFSAEGARVAAHYHTQRESAERLCAEMGASSLAVRADLRVEAQVDEMFSSVVRAFGRIDAVVVNAGIWRAEEVPIHALSLDQWRETMEADLTSAFLTCRGFLRHLAEVPRESASLVLVASTAAMFGEADHADYSAAKAAMAYGLTRSLKNEIVRLAPRGRVNCVCPGWTATPMALSHDAADESIDRATATMSLRKIAEADDVASAIVFLSSDRLAGHLSGTVLPVAGGMEGRLLHP